MDTITLYLKYMVRFITEIKIKNDGPHKYFGVKHDRN